MCSQCRYHTETEDDVRATDDDHDDDDQAVDFQDDQAVDVHEDVRGDDPDDLVTDDEEDDEQQLPFAQHPFDHGRPRHAVSWRW